MEPPWILVDEAVDPVYHRAVRLRNCHDRLSAGHRLEDGEVLTVAAPRRDRVE